MSISRVRPKKTLVRFSVYRVNSSISFRHALATKLEKGGTGQIDKNQDVANGPRHQLSFFQKCVQGQMFPPEPAHKTAK